MGEQVSGSRVLVIDTGGSLTAKEMPAEDDGQLRWLQGEVGGYIEMVRLDPWVVMLVNEDGLSLQLRYNSEASAIAGRDIVGNVVIAGDDQRGGMVGLADVQFRFFGHLAGVTDVTPEID